MALMAVGAAAVLVYASAGAARADNTPKGKVVKVADKPAGSEAESLLEQPCPDAQQAISFYRGKYREHREKMSLAGPVPRAWYDCEAARRRAAEWRDRAAQAAEALKEWHEEHWNWRDWLPDKWQRIGACETGYGQRPGNWQHNSGSYQGAFGFANGSWDGFVSSADPAYGPYPPNADEATPRQQYEVALAIYRRYGLSGWGCRGA
jgi:hypothetical protein